jgi:hypothetical protein
MTEQENEQNQQTGNAAPGTEAGVTGDPRPWTPSPNAAENVQAPQNAEELAEAQAVVPVSPSDAAMTEEEQARREASLRDDASAEEVPGGDREPQQENQ